MNIQSISSSMCAVNCQPLRSQGARVVANDVAKSPVAFGGARVVANDVTKSPVTFSGAQGAQTTMGVQSALGTQAAQTPAQPISFKSNDIDEGDVFTPLEPSTQEQKLDLACRLAAYYQSQFEKLQQKTGCYV